MEFRRTIGNTRLRLVPVLLLILFVAGGCGHSSGPLGDVASAPPPLTPDQTNLNLESFDMVWTTIRDKHWDPELGGLDWQAIIEELRPQVAAAVTMDEAREVMNDLIGRLDQSHFGIFPGTVYEDAAAATGADNNGTGGVTGLEVRVRDGQTLVVSVLPGSPADLAGIAAGWEVLSVQGTELAPRVEKVMEAFKDKTSLGLMASMAMQSRLTGDVGETLPLVFRDGADQQVELDLVLVGERGTATTLGNLPSVRVWHETRTLPGGIGYFGFNYFLGIMDVMPAFNQAMQDFTTAEGGPVKGVIIDLRGNPGGLGAMAMGMSGWFVEGKGRQLGVMIMRNGDLKFAINPRAQGFLGPLALLVDEVSASTSEIMAGGLQDLGRAKLFGLTTAGAALPSMIEKLPNGDGFQYAVANYISEGGRQLEGQGVVPDFEIIADRNALLVEGDPVLKAAVAWINSQ